MHRKHNPDVVIRTDASPYGMGGILFYKGNPQKWWASALTPDDLSLFAATIGDPAFQAEWELLAILTSVVARADCLQSCLVGMIESDIWAALNATMKMASSTPSMNALGAEIGIRMASYRAYFQVAHVPGVCNVECDALSRLSCGYQVPASLLEVARTGGTSRRGSFFLAWSNHAET